MYSLSPITQQKTAPKNLKSNIYTSSSNKNAQIYSILYLNIPDSEA